MKIIKFTGSNATFAKDQPEYQQLPAYVDPGTHGAVTSAWKLSIFERLKVLFTGTIWLQLLMFRKPDGSLNPLTPQYLTLNKKEVVYNVADPEAKKTEYVSEDYAKSLLTDAGFDPMSIGDIIGFLFPKP